MRAGCPPAVLRLSGTFAGPAHGSARWRRSRRAWSLLALQRTFWTGGPPPPPSCLQPRCLAPVCVLSAAAAAAFSAACKRHRTGQLSQSDKLPEAVHTQNWCRRDTLLLLCVRSVRCGGGGEAALAARALALLAITLGAGDASERQDPVCKPSDAACKDLQAGGRAACGCTRERQCRCSRVWQAVRRAMPARGRLRCLGRVAGCGLKEDPAGALDLAPGKAQAPGSALGCYVSTLLALVNTPASPASTWRLTPGCTARIAWCRTMWNMQGAGPHLRTPQQLRRCWAGRALTPGSLAAARADG